MLEILRILVIEGPPNFSIRLPDFFDHPVVAVHGSHMRLELALRLLTFKALSHDAGFVKVEPDCTFLSVHFFIGLS